MLAVNKKVCFALLLRLLSYRTFLGYDTLSQH